MTSAHRVQQIGAKHIGRVGALAFALGVGAAIAGGSGVAWAEPSTSTSTSRSESTQSSDSTDGPTAAAAESEAGPGAGGTDESTDDGDGTDAESADADTTEAEAAEVEAEAAEELAEALAESEQDELDVSESLAETADSESDAAEEALPDIPADDDSDSPLAAETVLRQEESAPPESDPATPAATLALSQTNDADAEPVAAGRETGSAEPAPALAAAAVAEPVAAAEPLGLLGWIERTFFNKTPTMTYDSLENSVADGVIVGNLNPTDPDSEVLTYTTTQPTYGAVEVLSDGTFRYTPGPDYVGHDTFKVTVSDAFGNGFQLHGFAQLLHIVTFGLLGSAGHSSTTTINIGFARTAVASGLNTPTDFQFLPDGPVIIAEKSGAIKVFEDGAPQGEAILNVPVSTEVERGISGLALDPDYASNGYLYVAYTTTGLRNRLSRFTVTDGVGDLGSELVLAQGDQQIAPNHHGGALGFGLDGKLYWGLGDNALRANSQNLSTLHGKILRLNPDGTVPADNPFLDIDALPQIFATGVRNPFRLTVAPDGSLLVADVGAAAFEELNNVTAGGNYGWPDAEGVCGACDSIDPIHAYPHGAGGAAITSVLVPDGSTFGASLDGKVLIADYLKGWIKVLTCDAGFSVCGQEQFFDPQAGRTVKLAQGPDGNIYQLTLDGTLYRIAPSDALSPSED